MNTKQIRTTENTNTTRKKTTRPKKNHYMLVDRASGWKRVAFMSIVIKRRINN
jgi:hypothetical protein